jgi:hypothetical protein
MGTAIRIALPFVQTACRFVHVRRIALCASRRFRQCSSDARARRC